MNRILYYHSLNIRYEYFKKSSTLDKKYNFKYNFYEMPEAFSTFEKISKLIYLKLYSELIKYRFL